MLLDSKLPRFDTVLHNMWYTFNVQWNSCTSDVVQYVTCIISDFPFICECRPRCVCVCACLYVYGPQWSDLNKLID